MAAQVQFLLEFLASAVALIGLCVFLFGRSRARLDAPTAQMRLREDVPGFEAGVFAIAADARSALAEDGRDGAIYLVTLRGDGIVTRRISRAALQKASRDGRALDLRMADFTFPNARIAFAEETLARDWEARFARLAA